MSSISESIVREYFELHGFFVRQQGKSIMPNRRDEEEIDFLVLNLNPVVAPGPLPLVLTSKDLAGVARAAVAVKPRHTESLSPTLLAAAPEFYRLGEPAVYESAARSFSGTPSLVKILAIPSLPQNEALRSQSLELLRAKGIDTVITFPTMLSDLISQIDPNRNYEKSDLLQLLRILKNYDFIKDPQLELFKPARKQKQKPRGPQSQPAADNTTSVETMVGPNEGAPGPAEQPPRILEN